MALELKAKVIQMNPEITGKSKNGPWRKQEVIVETGGNYPKKVCISIWGDKIDQFGLQQNESYTFSIDVESREYNGRWYTDVKAYDAKSDTNTGIQDQPPFPSDEDFSQDDDDSLPF